MDISKFCNEYQSYTTLVKSPWEDTAIWEINQSYAISWIRFKLTSFAMSRVPVSMFISQVASQAGSTTNILSNIFDLWLFQIVW